MYVISISNESPKWTIPYAVGESLVNAVIQALSNKYPELASKISDIPGTQDATVQDIEVLGGGFRFDWDVGQGDVEVKIPTPLDQLTVCAVRSIELQTSVRAYDNYDVSVLVGGTNKLPKVAQLFNRDILFLVRPKYHEKLRKEIGKYLLKFIKDNQKEITLEHVIGYEQMLYNAAMNTPTAIRDNDLFSNFTNTSSLRMFTLLKGIRTKLKGVYTRYLPTSTYPIVIQVHKGLTKTELALISEYVKKLVDTESPFKFSLENLGVDIQKTGKYTADMIGAM